MALEVRRQGRGWGIYEGAALVEGGFFSRAAAEAWREEREREDAREAAREGRCEGREYRRQAGGCHE